MSNNSATADGDQGPNLDRIIQRAVAIVAILGFGLGLWSAFHAWGVNQENAELQSRLAAPSFRLSDGQLILTAPEGGSLSGLDLIEVRPLWDLSDLLLANRDPNEAFGDIVRIPFEPLLDSSGSLVINDIVDRVCNLQIENTLCQRDDPNSPRLLEPSALEVSITVLGVRSMDVLNISQASGS